MSLSSRGIRWPRLWTVAVGLLVSTGMTARTAVAGHPGGHGGRAPRVSAPRPAQTATRMPRAKAPAFIPAPRNRPSASHPSTHAGGRQNRANKSLASTNHRAGRVNGAMVPSRTRSANGPSARASGAGTSGSGGVSPAARASANALGSLSGSGSSHRYTYGTGAGARAYRAYGYGRGYRNRYYGAGYGYGRSQGLNRGIVSRLRSVHAGLARLDHDYQGHRARAMHSISMAIRQLSNQSMFSTAAGSGAGLNNRAGLAQGMGMGIGMGQGRGQGQGQGMRRSALGAGGLGGPRMSQAQSDARMSQALRNLQGIGMQLGNQGYQTMAHGRALGHIQRAVSELNVALSIR